MSRSHRLVQVAVGVICQGDTILIAKRPAHLHCGDLWEFPGGKIENQETTFQALKRECFEELGIEVTASEPLTDITHHYPEKSVQLNVHRVTAFEGEAQGREGQAIRWVSLADLSAYDFPEANHAIISALSL